MSKLTEFCEGFKNFCVDFKPWGIPKLHFVKSEWEKIEEPLEVSGWYLFWRGFYAFYCLILVGISIYIEEYRHLWIIYMSRWNITFQLIYSWLFFLNVCCYKCFGARRGRRDRGEVYENIQLARDCAGRKEAAVFLKNKNNFVESLLWVMSGVVGPLPILVALMYWGLVYIPGEMKFWSQIQIAETIGAHGVNVIFAIVDTMVVAVPVRVSHSFFLPAFGTCYTLFTWLFDKLGGEYPIYPSEPPCPCIYSLLNWREKPGTALLVGAMMIPIMNMFYYIQWLLYIIRLRIITCCAGGEQRRLRYFLHRYWRHPENPTST